MATNLCYNRDIFQPGPSHCTKNTMSPFTNDFRIIKSINFEIDPNYLTLKWASHRNLVYPHIWYIKYVM